MKNYKTIISMMSGTSIDGIDACLVKIFDDLSFKVIDNYSLDYPKEIKERLFALAKYLLFSRDISSAKETALISP